MGIEYEKSDKKGLTFGDVEDDQWFYDTRGYLCAKEYCDRYVMIADEDCKPYVYHCVCAKDMPIKARCKKIVTLTAEIEGD